MTSVGVRDLQRNTSKIVEEVSTTGRPVLVTCHGRPTVAIYAITESDVEDWLLATAPEFVESMLEADADLRAGMTRPAADVFAEIEAELGDD